MIQKRLGAPVLATLLLAAPAAAQPAPQPTPNPDRREPAPQPGTPEPPGLDELEIDERALDEVSKTEGDGLTRDVVAEALAKQPGGLTLDDVAARASATSRQVAAAQAQLRVSKARVDQAFASYFPKLTFQASYTRQSPIENQIGPGVTFPIIENVWALTAQVDVPLSDYLLRLTRAYAAADADVEARRLEVEATKLQAKANAKIAYFNWVRAQGQGAVAGVGVALAKRDLQDARVGLRAGVLTEADVARLEAQLAGAVNLQNQARAMARVAGQALRTQMHLDPKAKLAIGIDVLAEPAPLPEAELEDLKRRALSERLDLKALDQTEQSIEDVVETTRAQHYPRLDAFANGLYGNPNPRIFPQANQWDFTWSAGVRLTWVVNDTFSTTSVAREQLAEAEQVHAQREALADAIELEVTQAFYDLEIARSAIVSAKQQEKALKISLEQRRKLFRVGNATATDIVDAEAQLIRAQLQRIDAQVDYLVAQARLELAVGGKL